MFRRLVFWKFVPLVLSGIWRKPGRAILLFVQVLSVFVLFGSLEGVNIGLHRAVAELAKDPLDVHSVGTYAPLPIAYLSRIQSVPGVLRVKFQNYLHGYYQLPTQRILAIATDPTTYFAMAPRLIIDKGALARLKADPAGALVGRTLAAKFGWRMGDRIPLKSTVRQVNGSSDWTFDEDGAFFIEGHPKSDDFMVINNSYFNSERKDQKNTATVFMAQVRNIGDAVTVAQAIDNVFRNSSDQTRTDSDQDFALSELASYGDLNFVANVITLAAVGALLLSSGALVMRSFVERQTEFAVLRTLGFSNFGIAALIIAEAMLLFLLAAAVGLVVSPLLFPFAKTYTEDFGGISMPWGVVAAGMVIAMTVALASAVIPVGESMKLQVVEALARRRL